MLAKLVINVFKILTDFSNSVGNQLCEFILDICIVWCCSLIVASADPVYNLLKGASLLSRKQGIGGDGDSSGVSSMRSLPRQNTASSGKSGSSRSSSPGNTNLYSFHFYPYSILGGSLLVERWYNWYGMLTRYPQCKFSLEFQEILSKNRIMPTFTECVWFFLTNALWGTF